MEAALYALATAAGRRHLATLTELGELQVSEHSRIGRLGRERGVELLAAPRYGVPDFHKPDVGLAARGGVGDGDVVLVKAGRRGRLERLAARLRSEADTDAKPCA